VKDILFLTLQYQRELEEHYIERSTVGVQGAVNAFETALVKGFSQLSCCTAVMNALPVGTFPFKYKDIILKSRKWDFDGIPCSEIGSINLPVIKQISRYVGFWRCVKRWIEDGAPIKDKCIVAYSLYLPFEMVLARVKKEYPEVQTCIICTDLPGRYGILPSNRLKAFLYEKHGEYQIRYTRIIDSFVLLTDAMRAPLNVADRKYVVVEGIASSMNPGKTEPGSEDRKVILYTGSLQYQFGIKTLLQAFRMIKKQDYELWICGSGDAEKEIKEIAKQDGRVRFFGYVSKEKIYELQAKSTVLVNPRTNEGEYTKYSFPSKTMEYMMSGVPVLMHKLSGIPAEYDPYLFYIGADTPEVLCSRLQEICDLPEKERAAFGAAAREFVANHKNEKAQAQKILDMLSELQR